MTWIEKVLQRRLQGIESGQEKELAISQAKPIVERLVTLIDNELDLEAVFNVALSTLCLIPPGAYLEVAKTECSLGIVRMDWELNPINQIVDISWDVDTKEITQAKFGGIDPAVIVEILDRADDWYRVAKADENYRPWVGEQSKGQT